MAARMYRDREFELLDGVYDPGEDSYLLVEAALNEVTPEDEVLEVGTGSGVVSLFMKDVSASVVATDISPAACENARLNGVEVVRTDLYRGICGRFDLVIFNPPYLPTSDEERLATWLNRAFDGGPTGRDQIARFLGGLDGVLAPWGRVIMVVSTLTGVDEIQEMFSRHGFYGVEVASEKVPFERLVALKFSRRPPGNHYFRDDVE